MSFEPVPVERRVDPTSADTETLVELGVVEPPPEPDPETPDAA